MDPEMVLNSEQKQFRFRNCLKKKMLKGIDQEQDQEPDRDGSPERQSGTPPSPFPPPPPMVPILRRPYDDINRGKSIPPKQEF